MSAAVPDVGPYARDALRWFKAGFAPLPLPPGVKWPPPKGWTGREGPWPDAAQVRVWARSHPDGNVALRLPRTVVGIDVDVYGDKPGDATLAALVERFGELPPTVRITSRGFENGSGIRLYRVPEGTELPGVLGPGIEVIQFHHRYCVAPGSVHPDGGIYEAWDERRGRVLGGVFRAADLA